VWEYHIRHDRPNHLWECHIRHDRPNHLGELSCFADILVGAESAPLRVIVKMVG
jgi:hypothetical protein